MKILIAHNYYQFPGGEDVIVHNEKELLEKEGHKVIFYKKENKEINEFSFFKKISLIWETTWSNKTYNEILKIIKEENPDICHIHNILPLISPSIYYACNSLNIPVIQSIHNYRLFCTNGFFFRNNQICEECLNSSAYHAIKLNCYRNSKIQAYSVAKNAGKS